MKMKTSRTSSAVGVFGLSTTVVSFLIDRPLATDAAIIIAGFDKTIRPLVNVGNDRYVTDQR